MTPVDPTPPPPTPPTRRRNPSSGALRPAGVVAAMVTAAAVFVVGMAILPAVSHEPEPVPVAPPPPPPPPPPAPEPAPDAAAADAGVAAVHPEPPAASPAPPAPAAVTPQGKPEAAAAAAAQVEAPAKDEASPPRDRSADKDLAREAWRKNQPDITTEPGKAALLVPIKGSIEGAVFHVSAKPRFVLVTLPKAESMITMPFYSIKHDGFSKLWLGKDKDSAATTVKLTLGDASDPQVEIKDDFIRVTVRRPVAAPQTAPAAEPAPAPPPAPAHD
jgi:hypothetical protein